MAQIKKINIKGVEYDIAGSGGSGITTIDKTIEYDENDNSFVVFTEDEYALITTSPYVIIRLSDASAESTELLLTPLMPQYNVDYSSGAAQSIPRFYGQCTLNVETDIETEGMTVMYILEPTDNPLIYQVNMSPETLFGSIYEMGSIDINNAFQVSLDGATGTFSDADYEQISLVGNSWSLLLNGKLYFLNIDFVDGDGNVQARFYYSAGHGRIWHAILDGAIYILTVSSDKTWSIHRVPDVEYPTNDYTFTPPNDSTFLSVQGTSGCTATTNASSTPLAINSAVSTYFGYPQLLVRNFSPLTTHATPAASAPTFMLAETGAGTNTGKQLELFYSPTWATENPALFTDTTTANLFHNNSMVNQAWYSLGTITIREGQWQGKKSLAGLSFNVNLTDDFSISSNTSGAVSINHIISLDLPMAGNRCIWQGMSPEFEVYQGITAIDNVSMSSIPSGKVYKRNYVGNAYSWIASSSATTLNNPVCFKLMHAFGPEAGLESSSNNSKYYNYQYESTGSARLQNDWTRVTCNVDEGTIDIANTKVISVTQLNVQLQY